MVGHGLPLQLPEAHHLHEGQAAAGGVALALRAVQLAVGDGVLPGAEVVPVFPRKPEGIKRKSLPGKISHHAPLPQQLPITNLCFSLRCYSDSLVPSGTSIAFSFTSAGFLQSSSSLSSSCPTVKAFPAVTPVGRARHCLCSFLISSGSSPVFPASSAGT